MTALDAQKRLTEAFIAVDPRVVTLIPQVKTSNGSGGFTLAPGIPRAPQTFTLLAQAKGQEEPTKTEDGQVMRTDYVLVGKYNAAIAPLDYWIDGDSRYTVEYILPYNGYEVRAGVTRYGT